MIFNPKEFLDQYGIRWRDKGKDTQKGWVNIKCPFCNDPEMHGGFNIQGQYYNCWKCKGHSLIDTIMALLNCSFAEAKSLLERYSNLALNLSNRAQDKRSYRPLTDTLDFPAGTRDLSDSGKQYLRSRNFDADKLVDIWQLKQTENYGDYKFRIIAPIYLDGRLVSYQGRDITGRQELRYKACKKADEIIYHKNLVYGTDHIKGKRIIIVEGITDAWRVGPGCVATFGTGFTQAQILFMVKRWDEFFIWYDPEDEAQQRADELFYGLSLYNKEVEIITTEKDPGDTDQGEADNIKKDILNL